MDLALLCLPGVLATMRGIPLRTVVGLGLCWLAAVPSPWLVFRDDLLRLRRCP
jgi:hypothetical protein